MCTTILYGCTSIKKPGVLEDHPPEMLHNPCVFMLRAALGFIKIIFLTAIQEDLFVVIPHIFISHEKHISTNSIIRRFSLLFFFHRPTKKFRFQHRCRGGDCAQIQQIFSWKWHVSEGFQSVRTGLFQLELSRFGADFD